MAVMPRGAESTRCLWFMARVGFAAAAVWVAVSESWDANGDGRISVHEALLFPVRFFAFPLHILLSLTPAPVLHALGLPDAHWPSSRYRRGGQLPVWGLLLIGGLLAEAWLERLPVHRTGADGHLMPPLPAASGSGWSRLRLPPSGPPRPRPFLGHAPMPRWRPATTAAQRP